MRGAVVQLDRWGLLDRVAEATPAITQTTFRYPSGDVAIELDPLYAPRRTVLDPIMIEAAREAGVTVRHETRLAAIRRSSAGPVDGVELEGAGSGFMASITVCMSLSPRPDRLTRTDAPCRWSLFLSTQAMACADSRAGMMPSVRLSSWKASRTSSSVTGWYSARSVLARWECSGPSPG